MNSAFMSSDDEASLQTAVRLLENPGLAARLAPWGKTIQRRWQCIACVGLPRHGAATEKGCNWLFAAALRTLRGDLWTVKEPAQSGSHRFGGLGRRVRPSYASVGIAGFHGHHAAVHPISHQRRRGPFPAGSRAVVHSGLRTGGRESSSGLDSGYFAVRSMLARTVAEAARYVAERSIVEEGAPGWSDSSLTWHRALA